MADERRDLFDECYAGDHKEHLNPDAFGQAFCRLCRNPGCTRSALGKSKWQYRIDTQVETLIENPRFADSDDPRYQVLREIDFPDILRKAIKLEVAAQRGDWEIPTGADAAELVEQLAAYPPGFQEPDAELPVTVLWEGQARGTGGQLYRLSYVEVGEERVWNCTCNAFKYETGGEHGCKHIREAMARYGNPPVEVPESRPAPRAIPTAPTGPGRHAPPEKWQQVAERGHLPKARNTSFPVGGIMVDGSAPPPQPMPRPEDSDPWAPKGDIVPVGGKVVLGGGKVEGGED